MHPLADPIASAVQQTSPPTQATDTTDTKTTTTPITIPTHISTIVVIAASTMGTRLPIPSFNTRNKKMILNWWIRARRPPDLQRVLDRRRGIIRINSSSLMLGGNSLVVRVEGVLIINSRILVEVEEVVEEVDVEEEVGTGITGGIGLIVRLRLLSSLIGLWLLIWI
jgi:hypothetical protein